MLCHAAPARRPSPAGHRAQHRRAPSIHFVPAGHRGLVACLRGRLGGRTRTHCPCGMAWSRHPGGCNSLAARLRAARITCGQGEGRDAGSRGAPGAVHPWRAALPPRSPPSQPRTLGYRRHVDTGACAEWDGWSCSPMPWSCPGVASGLGMPHGSRCAALSPPYPSEQLPAGTAGAGSTLLAPEPRGLLSGALRVLCQWCRQAGWGGGPGCSATYPPPC